MTIARVVGQVIASQSADRLEGPTYLLVRPATSAGKPEGSVMVAVDAVQAGEGDVVLVAQGSSCRQIAAPDSPDTTNGAVDALIVGVVDLVDENGSVTYRAEGDA